MQSADVIHSLWIPQMGQKQDVVPGITTKIVITPTRTGNFTLICTELCGLGHATMRAPVRVLDQAAFRRWLDEQRAAGAGAAARRSRRRTEQRGSAAAARRARQDDLRLRGLRGLPRVQAGGDRRTSGRISTTSSRTPRRRVRTRGSYIKQSIVDPNAVIVSGFQPGVMPTTFGKTLSPAELRGSSRS